MDYTNKAKKYKKDKEEDPFEYEKHAINYWFHSYFQQDFYHTIIYPKNKPIITVQWIDWHYMAKKNNPLFNEIITACEAKNMKRIMGFKYD